MKKILRLLSQSFYLTTAVLFGIWMIFFDSNDVLSQYRLKSKLKDLESSKIHYEKEIKKIEKDREELLTNKRLLEKFAREKYLMKKPKEDIFILVKKEDD